MTLKELQEQRRKQAEQIRSFHKDNFDSESNSWKDQEARTNWEKLGSDYDETVAAIERQHDAEQTEARLSLLNEHDERREPGPFDRGEGRNSDRGEQRHGERRGGGLSEEEASALALQAWFRSESALGLEDRHVEACRQLRFNPNCGGFDITMRSGFERSQPAWSFRGSNAVDRRFESRAQSVGTTTEGGYLVPEGFMNNLERALLQFGGPRQVARIMRTDMGNDIPWPTVDDTGNTGADIAENAGVDEEDLVFGSVTLKAYKAESKAVLVSQELLEDSAFNLSMIIPDMLGERLGRFTAARYTTGSGVGQQQGIVTGASLGVTADSATTIAADELFELQHSVDPAYRDLPSAGWMFHDNILLHVRTLKDDQNQYLWREGLSADAPDRLLGKPYTINQHMSSTMATTNKTMLFGAFEKFVIRDVRSIRIYRLEERYRDRDQTGFMAFMRTDSRVIDAGTGPIKYLQQQ